MAIPAALDCATSMLHYFALNFIAGSIYQILRGGSILTTFLFSVTFLKAKVLRNRIAGSVIAVFGVLIVGASNFYFNSSSSTNSDTVQMI